MFAHVIAAEDEDPLFTIYGPGTFIRAPFRAPQVDGQNAFAKGLIDGYEPLFERVGFLGVLCTDLLNATADLTNH